MYLQQTLQRSYIAMCNTSIPFPLSCIYYYRIAVVAKYYNIAINIIAANIVHAYYIAK